MSKQIWKDQLNTTDIQQVEMPADAEILTIQVQYDVPCIWALVSPDAPRQNFTFEIFGTGHNVPENAERRYIGTYQHRSGMLVFHCFQLLRLL